MLDDAQLTEMEQQACDLVRGAGAILLRYFDQPLSIDYKSANNRNPVTDADHAADEYLRAELSRRFPEHGIVTEETESADDEPKEITWVVDPLDGTTNFLHGLPMFACMVCALERGTPVAGAIYIPHIGSADGRVIHTRRGGGAFQDDVPLSIETSDPPRRMASVPGYFLRMFTPRKNMRRRLGDLRNTGSAGYEMAMTARGVFDYTVFNGPWVWDLATGILAVQEAGGTATRPLRHSARRTRWASLHERRIATPGLAGHDSASERASPLARPALVWEARDSGDHHVRRFSEDVPHPPAAPARCPDVRQGPGARGCARRTAEAGAVASLVRITG